MKPWLVFKQANYNINISSDPLTQNRLDPVPAPRGLANKGCWEWEAADGDTFGELALFRDLSGSLNNLL